MGMLAIIFLFEHFYQYTFGHHVSVESDYKPLEVILQKLLSCTTWRLQSMIWCYKSMASRSVMSGAKTCIWPTCCCKLSFHLKEMMRTTSSSWTWSATCPFPTSVSMKWTLKLGELIQNHPQGLARRKEICPWTDSPIFRHAEWVDSSRWIDFQSKCCGDP